MPCNDCSRAEKCPPCVNGEECKHPNKQYTGALYDGPAGRKTFLFYRCLDCKASLKEEEKRCEGCGCPPKRTLCGSCDAGLPMECTCPPEECVCDSPEEPPMTPEEEEQAPCPHESWDVTSEWGDKDADGKFTGQWWKTRRCNDCGEDLDNVLEDEPHWDLQPGTPIPPQPDRRPPSLVAYSVQGHLYEVALPGDASVRAVDGALVITHALGPVSGIVQVQPVPKEGA